MQINGYTQKYINVHELSCINGHLGKLNKNKNTITCEECKSECEWKRCCTCTVDSWTNIACESCYHDGCEACLVYIWKDCAECGYCLCKCCYYSCEIMNCEYKMQKYCNNHITQCNEESCEYYQVYICKTCVITTCNHNK